MNEDDIKTTEIIDKKLKKTTSAKSKAKVETDAVQIKAEKKTRKKIEAKTEPIVEAAAKTKAKTQKIAMVKTEVETEPKVKQAEAQTAIKTEAVAKTKTNAPKSAPKIKVEAKAETKAESKVSKPKAKKAVAEKIKTVSSLKPIVLEAPIKLEPTIETVEAEELSPIFKELAEPKLPALAEENRAYLQIQSPTRIFFYWSLKENSFETLRRVVGNRANDYRLGAKLFNLTNETEEVFPIESKGSAWFNVESDTKYRAEVGFFAPHRPFIRIVFSNTLETPRLKPSSNRDYQPYFAVTADQFAEVLDLAGFSQDAFDVSLAGDEPLIADEATQKAFIQLLGKDEVDFSNINLNELRYVLFALASGVSLFALREQVSSNIYEFLAALVNENADVLTEEKVILALEEFFGFSNLEEEEITEEYPLPTVFGASLINFPKGMRTGKSSFTPNKRRFSEDKLSPLSSFLLK